MIPGDAEKPIDPRLENKLPNNVLSAELSHLIASTTIPMPGNNPDAVLGGIQDERLRLQYERF